VSYYDRQFLGLNPRDFGAKGDGVTDDTLAFQACQAEALASGINAISFDDGVYVIGDRTMPTTLSGGCHILGDIGADGFLFEGTGPGAVLLIGPNQDGAPSFSVVGLQSVLEPVSKRVTLRNFRIDGNAANITIGGQSVTGIGIRSGEDIVIENVIAHDIPSNNESRGMGFSIGATQDLEFVYRVNVRDCIAYGCAGSGFQYLNADQFSSLENSIAYDNFGPGIYLRNLSTSQAARSVFVRNCTAVTGPNSAGGGFNDVAIILDASVATPGEDIQLDGCSCLGRFQVNDTNRAFVDDCIIYANLSNTLILGGNGSRIVFSNSIIGGGTGGDLIQLTTAGGGGPRIDWAFRNNVMLPLRRAINGNVEADAEIDGNVIIYDGTTLGDYQCIFSGTSANSALRFRRNVLVGDMWAVRMTASVANAYQQSMIFSDNFFGTGNVNRAVDFQTSGAGTYASRPVLHNNVLGSSMTRLLSDIDIARFPQDAIIVGGNYDTIDNLLQVALPHCLGDGSPSGVVFGRPGDEYTDINGGAGTIHYVKDTGNVTSGGWVAK